MDFQFDPAQQHQLDAIQSAVGVFEGQPKRDAPSFELIGTATAVSNGDLLPRQVIFDNVRRIQAEGGLTPEPADDRSGWITASADVGGIQTDVTFPNFAVEMETGTGKTYVYIRTALELYRNFGFRKFIIVVPGVAVRETVNEAFASLATHLKELYPATPYRVSTYSSTTPTTVRQFALSDAVEFLIMTLDSFNKSGNVIKRASDRLQGETPLHLLQATRPILLLDEPQNMESEQSVEALASLAPMAALRFSATHRKSYYLIHRLTPYDAYRGGLVKRIEVASVLSDLDANQPYLRLISISAVGKKISAKVEVHQRLASGAVKAKPALVQPGINLGDITKRQEYNDYCVEEINSGQSFVRFENGEEIALGEEWGVDRARLVKEQIRYTVREHMLKQRRLSKQGIKVLSLFFIDHVANYQGEEAPLRQAFAEVFDELKAGFPQFASMQVTDVQAAYFAERRTKKGTKAIDSSGDSKEDEAAFQLIMRNKRRLLSMDEPVSFIFSHSALREGWDNPNVFQICTLAAARSDIRKRQEIGRGVRLCVDSDGSRVFDENVNVLTVVANESYESYVEGLQAELQEDAPGQTLPPPPPDARKRGQASLRKAATLSDDFVQLWSRISAKTRYTVSIDTDRLVAEAVPIIERAAVEAPKIYLQKAAVHLDDAADKLSAVVLTARKAATTAAETPSSLPNMTQLVQDILATSSNPVRLTRRTVTRVLAAVKHVPGFMENPHGICVVVANALRRASAEQLVDGIKYVQSGEFYEMASLADEVTSWEEYLVPSPHGLYDQVVSDSQVERDFVEGLESRDDVLLYAKLPNWFKVRTPVGGYNPDWALVMEERDEHGQSQQRLYLVRETKSVDDPWLLSETERRKVQCGQRHFESALGVDFKVVSTAESLP